MKKFKAIVLILIALSLTVSFVSCTKDNDPDTELPIADIEQTPNDNSNNSESLNVERMTLEEVKKIIAENDTYEEILSALNERQTQGQINAEKLLVFYLSDSEVDVIHVAVGVENIAVMYLKSETLYTGKGRLGPLELDESKHSDERMTLEEVKKIIAENDNYTEIVSALMSRQTPDATYGSGMTISSFKLDDYGDEFINIWYEGPLIRYTKRELLYGSRSLYYSVISEYE